MATGTTGGTATGAAKQTPKLTDAEFVELQDFIYRKTGMFFPLSRKHYIEQRVWKRIRILRYENFSDYFHILENELIRTEILNLFNEITVNETFFFRDPAQLEVLEKQILPEHQARGKRVINILSAGCSSGEEAYTIALILRERFPGLGFNIVGVDISDLMVEKARRGEFSRYAVRFVPDNYMNKCFTRLKKDHYKLADPYKAGVVFRKCNLMDLEAQFKGQVFDIIFCRYVLIYFDRESKRQVVSGLHGRLVAGGYLFLGNSESLSSVTGAGDFRMLHFPSAIVYRRG